MSVAPLKTFIIYASQDRDLRTELERHLKLLEIEGSIKLWSDKEILPGEHWDKAIKKQLAVTDLFLMLVSVDFFNSEYIQQKEFKTALQRLESGDSLAIPIIVRPCFWKKNAVISNLQVLPPEGRAVTDWPTHDAAWTAVVERVVDRVEQLLAERAEAKRQRKEAQERRAHETEQARLDELGKQRQAEAAARAEQERLDRERAEAKRRQQEEKERLAKETEQARLAEQARIAEQKRQAEVAARAEQERLARERTEREAREEEARRQAERKKQEEEQTRKYQEAYGIAWRKAESQDTAQAYRDFLNAYPTGIYVIEAKKRIKQLEPKSRKYAWMLGGLGTILLLWFVIKLIAGLTNEKRAPGFYLKDSVLDGTSVTVGVLDYVPEKDGAEEESAFKSLAGQCFRSPDGSREILKGTRITEENLDRCAGIYAAIDLPAGTSITKEILEIEEPKPGSRLQGALYDYEAQLHEKGFCIKCETQLYRGEQITFENIQRSGGVYLKKEVSPGTVIKDEMVEEVPVVPCIRRETLKTKKEVVYGKERILNSPISRNKRKYPAGKQLDYTDF